MKTRAKAYIAAVSIIGYTLGIWFVVGFVLPVLRGMYSIDLALLIVPIVICSICRSLPIPIREGEVIDLSIIGVVATFLSHGTGAAVFTYCASTFFTFLSAEGGKKYRHIFSIGPEKVVFNDATTILAIVLPGILIQNCFAWNVGDLTLPGVLLPMCVFSILTFAINGILQVGLFCLNDMIETSEMASMLLHLMPNVLAAIPLGFLLSYGYVDSMRMWLTLLLFLPLLLARYAWKLYLYSSSEQSRLIHVLINTIEARDKYTRGHSERVAKYSLQIARAMNISSRRIALLRQGAILHDVGKIGVPDQILNKPGRLDDDETAQIRSHPLVGVKILEEVGLNPEILRIVRSHHERYDGAGYPEGLPLSELDVLVRIVSVADAYDAMTSDRPYRSRLSQERAIEILNGCKGTQFDPEVVDVFIRTLE